MGRLETPPEFKDWASNTLPMRFGQPNPFLVLHAPSGIIKSQQLVALIRSLFVAFTRREALYRRELRSLGGRRKPKADWSIPKRPSGISSLD